METWLFFTRQQQLETMKKFRGCPHFKEKSVVYIIVVWFLMYIGLYPNSVWVCWMVLWRSGRWEWSIFDEVKMDFGKDNKRNSESYSYSLKIKGQNWGIKALILRTWIWYEEHYKVDKILEDFVLCCFLCFDLQDHLNSNVSIFQLYFD